jgi:hypothetical protein
MQEIAQANLPLGVREVGREVQKGNDHGVSKALKKAVDASAGVAGGQAKKLAKLAVGMNPVECKAKQRLVGRGQVCGPAEDV